VSAGDPREREKEIRGKKEKSRKGRKERNMCSDGGGVKGVLDRGLFSGRMRGGKKKFKRKRSRWPRVLAEF